MLHALWAHVIDCRQEFVLVNLGWLPTNAIPDAVARTVGHRVGGAGKRKNDALQTLEQTAQEREFDIIGMLHPCERVR